MVPPKAVLLRCPFSLITPLLRSFRRLVSFRGVLADVANEREEKAMHTQKVHPFVPADFPYQLC